MESKAPRPERLHPMNIVPAYVSPCRLEFANALAAYAHWLLCLLCHVIMACDDCGAIGDGEHDPNVEH